MTMKDIDEELDQEYEYEDEEEMEEDLQSQEQCEEVEKPKEPIKKPEPPKPLELKDLSSAEIVIKDYLDKMIEQDNDFSKVYDSKPESIRKCMNYIASEAKKRFSNNCCMSDDEVFGLAVHYFQEDELKKQNIDLSSTAKVYATKAELTDEEKKKIEEIALKEYEESKKNARKAEEEAKQKAIDEIKAKAIEKAKEREAKEREELKKQGFEQVTLF